ncbi:restriction endonuclease [Asanoa ferruginea]|uniref:Restriction endonuclease n=2 Tax=Asanoa ferruginea TaxID=53367 RepID=A0A3E0A4F4_9ACTN|nr:restriction endonuclease [Asanoa ferruginea]
MAKPRIDDEAVRLLAHHPELLYTLSPRQFEEIVADILVRSGFNHVHLTPPSRDGGVDIYAKKDDLVGTSLYLVECKLWRPENPVGRPVLQKLYGVLADKRANKAVVVATTRFTKDAREWAADKPYQMALRDYDAVTTWLGQCLDEG